MPAPTKRMKSLRPKPPLRFFFGLWRFGASRSASLASLSAVTASETLRWNFLSSRTVVAGPFPFCSRAKALRADSIAARTFSRSSSSEITRWTYGAAATAPAFAAFFLAAIDYLTSGRFRANANHIPGALAANAGLLERDVEHFGDVGHEVELQIAPQVLGDLVDVGLVELRGDDGPDTEALRRECLLLQPADRQDLAREGDLAGHRDVVAHRAPG